MKLATVNKKLKEMGLDTELVKGEGYFYFFGPDTEYADHTSVMVCKLNDLDLDSWISEAKGFVENSKKRKEYHELSDFSMFKRK